MDELRVLLVHGILHLCGMDHERSPAEHDQMAQEEQATLAALGWEGKGLISAAEDEQNTKEPLERKVSKDPKQLEKEGKGDDKEMDTQKLGSIWQMAMLPSDEAAEKGNYIRRAAQTAKRTRAGS
jgi:hypothetical protein